MQAKRYLEEEVLERWTAENDCYFVHLDDDVQLSQGWLMAAWSALDACGWDASGSVEFCDEELVFSGQEHLEINELEVSGRTVRVWTSTRQKVPDGRICSTVRFAGHRALLVRLDIVSRVKHDTAMLIGGEDLDYSLALERAGYRIGISHQALIYHRSFGESDAQGFRTYEKVLRSWRHFYSKWGFVRRSACLEAGLDEHEWLRLVSAPL